MATYSWTTKLMQQARTALANQRTACTDEATWADQLQRTVQESANQQNSHLIFLACLELTKINSNTTKPQAKRITKLLDLAAELGHIAKINSVRSKLYNEWVEYELVRTQWQCGDTPSYAKLQLLINMVDALNDPMHPTAVSVNLYVADELLNIGEGPAALAIYEQFQHCLTDPAHLARAILGRARCLRLHGRRAEAADQLDSSKTSIPVLTSRIGMEWEQLRLAARGPESLPALVTWLQQAPHADPNYDYRALLAIYANKHAPQITGHKLGTLKRKLGKQFAGHDRFKKVSNVISALEQSGDTDIPAKIKIDQLITAADLSHQLHNSEDRLLAYRAISRALRRLNKLDLCQISDMAYARLSAELSGGATEDALAVGSSLRQIRPAQSDAPDKLDSSSWAFVRDSGIAIARMASFSTKMAFDGLRTPLDKAAAKEKHRQELARELVKVMDGRKGTFVKLGQLISFLEKPFGDIIREEFAVLQANASPMPARKTEQLLEQEFGRSPQDMFACWNSKATNAGSIGQVHKARLHTGEQVAVKVKYPGVEELIEADLDRASSLNFIFQKLVPNIDMDGIAQEVRTQIMQETNYLLERHYIDHFRQMWAEHPQISIPNTYPALSSRDVITMDWIDGPNILEFGKSATQEQRNEVAALLIHFIQVSKGCYGVFNSDPHPGNFIVTLNRKGRPVLNAIDFGNIKDFTKHFHLCRNRLMQATIDRDKAELTQVFRDMGFVSQDYPLDPELIYEAYKSTLAPYMIEGPAKFDREFMANAQATLAGKHPYADVMAMPPEHLFVLRYDLEAHHILSELEAEVDVNKITREALERARQTDAVEAKAS